MNFEPHVSLLTLGRHLVWSRADGRGGFTSFYYDDEITWLIAATVLLWVGWLLLSRYLRARRLRRPPPRIERQALKRAIKAKEELSTRYLRQGSGQRIHAVGVGRLEDTGQYCVQIFINDQNGELWAGAGNGTLPNSHLGLPVTQVSMRGAAFLTEGSASPTSAKDFANGIRNQQQVIVGGISGAHTNLIGQSGTIGYFCRRRSRIRRTPATLLISNSHVFADLSKKEITERDLIIQPSPGEPGSNRPIATLVDYSAITFEDSQAPNHVDAAIAKLWNAQTHDLVIPLIGGVKGYVEKQDADIGECVCKFGRTTGFSEGRLFSIYLDIWIRYDRTGRNAFFKDQILIEPAADKYQEFVRGGDSGSLLVDGKQHALGLIFAGTSQAAALNEAEPAAGIKSVEGYGVANPISEVLDRLKIELIVPE